MEFSFEVNPDLDLAIGSELSSEEQDSSFEVEDFDFADCDPLSPTGAKPGSEDKVKMLAARYAAGVPLWHDSDCYDHGPDAAAYDSGYEDELDLDEEF